jgi:hypothetical protein
MDRLILYVKHTEYLLVNLDSEVANSMGNVLNVAFAAREGLQAREVLLKREALSTREALCSQLAKFGERRYTGSPEYGYSPGQHWGIEALTIPKLDISLNPLGLQLGICFIPPSQSPQSQLTPTSARKPHNTRHKHGY